MAGSQRMEQRSAPALVRLVVYARTKLDKLGAELQAPLSVAIADSHGMQVAVQLQLSRTAAQVRFDLVQSIRLLLLLSLHLRLFPPRRLRYRDAAVAALAC